MHELLVEKYANTTYHHNPTVQTYRWLVPGYPLVCGGSIIDAADWEHIRKDFGAEYCINVQTEKSNVGHVPPDRLCEVPTEDAHAPPIPHENLAKVLEYALSKPSDAKLYVHCQMGGSRTPAFVYLILRGKYGLGPDAALAKLNEGFIERERDHHGDAAVAFGAGPDDARRQGHWRYLNSIESYLKSRELGGRLGALGPIGGPAGPQPDPNPGANGPAGAPPERRLRVAIIYPSVAMARQLDVPNLDTDPRGLTGSEGTAIGYAVGLAALGHEVTFFANVAQNSTYRGVSCLHDSHWEPEQADRFDAVVCFMNSGPLINCNPKCLRVFNMQCGDFGGQPTGWENHVDVLCTLSHKHAHEMKPTTGYPAEHWRVMYNGVDTESFKPGLKIPGRCIWASSHDRGLHHVLEAWPEVRAAVPHAELHVFYDVNGLERFATMGATDVPFLQELQRRSIYTIEMMRRLQNHGVFLGGSCSRERMRDEMAKAEVLAYPTDPVRFTETFGCTVLEAMSAGCVPVLCFADAFHELWESRGCPGVEWPYEQHREEYVAKLINALRHPQQWATPLREKAHDFGWQVVVSKLEQCLLTRGAEGLERPSFSDVEPVEYVKYQPYFERAA